MRSAALLLQKPFKEKDADVHALLCWQAFIS
jgi:hypothetical protein